MAVIRDQAVVLSRLDYSETSQIIVLFTRQHGKVRAIAKGIRRGTKTRFAAGIDLLDMGHVVVSSRRERSANLATVTEWIQTRSLSGLREKIFRIHGAEYVADITGHLTEDWDPHVALFDALGAALGDLSGASEPLAPVVDYQVRLVQAIGSLPQFDACMQCGRLNDLTHFSSFEGGMICRHCEPGQVEKWAVSPATLKTICGFVRSCALQAPHTSAQAEPCGSADTTVDITRVEQTPERARPARRTSLVGAFGLLNYHIAHLMGREPQLASRLVPPARRRIVE